MDFSAELHPSAGLGDLDPALIDRFRSMWRKKSGNEDLDRLPLPQLLTDAELIVNGKVTIAEGELLRAISDSLGCPMPPLLPGDSIPAAARPAARTG